MPSFVKDEQVWEKAKQISKKAGNKKGTKPFWKFANYMYFKMTNQKKEVTNEMWSVGGLGTQVPGYGSNGPTAYPMLASPQRYDKELDHEQDGFSNFKTWFDNKEKKSESEKLLTRVEKNKFDTTKEKHTIPGSKKSIYPKKDKITVWGAPDSFSYIRA